MLFRTEAAVLSGITKPTYTNKLCTWNVPATSKQLLEIKRISELTFEKDHYRKSSNKESAILAKNHHMSHKYQVYKILIMFVKNFIMH